MEMEVTVASWVALSLVFVSIAVRWAWSMLDWLWLKPKKFERCLREQGLQGRSYRFLYGDLKENSVLLNQARSKPMNLSASGHDIAPRFIPVLDQTVKTYGKNSFYWNGPIPRVAIMNPEDMKDVFTKLDDFRKPPSNPLRKLLATGVASYEGEKWAKHRKIINPTFHIEKLKKMLPAFHESCDEMIKEWESLASREGSSCELDVWPSLQHLTADVISRTAFGSSYQEGKKIFELLKEQSLLVISTLQSVYIPGWRFLPTKKNKRMKEIDREVKGLLKGIIISKREKAIEAGEATKDDLLGALLESKFNDIQGTSTLSIEDVIEECQLFYFAGQETTSVLLVWTMILLAQNQDWQDRARQEVLQVFGSNKPDFDGLTHLKSVTMVLLEVLRLYTPLVWLIRTTGKETQLRNFSLPAGVQVALPTVLIHRDKELWGDDANEFDPERFSEGVSKATKSPISFFPFGGGPRICVGQNFAMVEAKLALALILQNFHFELSPSYAHAPSSPLIRPQYGAPIILQKR